MITWKKLIRKCNFVVQSSKARAVKSLIDYQKFQTVSTFTFKGIFAKSSFLTFWGHHAISKFKQRFFVTYPIIQASRWRISYVVCITEKSSFSHTKFSDLLCFITKCHFWLEVLIFNWLMVWNRKQLHTLVLNYLLVVSKESIIFSVNWLYILTLWQQDSNWASKWAVCWDHIVALYRPLWTWTEKRGRSIWGNLLHLRENL